MKSSFAMVPAPWQQWMGGLCYWGKCASVQVAISFDFFFFFPQTYPAHPWHRGDLLWTGPCNATMEPCPPRCHHGQNVAFERQQSSFRGALCFIVGVELEPDSWIDILPGVKSLHVSYFKNCPKSSQSFSQPGHLHTPWPYSGWVPPLSSCRELKQRKGSTFRGPTAGG